MKVDGYLLLKRREGRVRLLFYDDCVEISDMFVYPEYRRAGVGQQILSEVLTIARGLELGRVSLHVEPDNIPAVALYQSFGFKQLRGETHTELKL